MEQTLDQAGLPALCCPQHNHFHPSHEEDGLIGRREKGEGGEEENGKGERGGREGRKRDTEGEKD